MVFKYILKKYQNYDLQIEIAINYTNQNPYILINHLL